MHSLELIKVTIGFSQDRVSTYYPPSSITKEEVQNVSGVVSTKGQKLETTNIISDDAFTFNSN